MSSWPSGYNISLASQRSPVQILVDTILWKKNSYFSTRGILVCDLISCYLISFNFFIYLLRSLLSFIILLIV
jgi:hypothetical protein